MSRVSLYVRVLLATVAAVAAILTAFTFSREWHLGGWSISVSPTMVRERACGFFFSRGQLFLINAERWEVAEAYELRHGTLPTAVSEVGFVTIPRSKWALNEAWANAGPGRVLLLTCGASSSSTPVGGELVEYEAVSLWLISAIPAAILIARRLCRRRRYPSGHCSRCGYDCRATLRRCPECGRDACS
jgi:hypothetical protein